MKAATGTGKTLAYLAPIVHLLQMREPRVERTHGTFGNDSLRSALVPFFLLHIRGGYALFIMVVFGVIKFGWWLYLLEFSYVTSLYI